MMSGSSENGQGFDSLQDSSPEEATIKMASLPYAEFPNVGEKGHSAKLLQLGCIDVPEQGSRWKNGLSHRVTNTQILLAPSQSSLKNPQSTANMFLIRCRPVA